MKDRPRFFVLLVTACACAYVVFQAHRYAVDLPFSDDYAFVQQISGREPVTLAWLWQTHNEHRMVLPKLVNVVATRITGGDFRAVANLSVIMLAACALVSVVTLARYRGRYRWADALPTLLICTWSQAESLTWTAPHNLVETSVMLLFWWGAASRFALAESSRSLAFAALAAAGIALSGASGVAAMVGIAPWFFWAAWRTGRMGPRACAALTGLLLSGYTLVCVMTYVRPEGHPTPASRAFAVRFFLRLLVSPFTTLDWLRDTAGALVAIAFALLLLVAFRRRGMLDRLAPTLALTAASLTICAAVSVGRAGFGTFEIASRYITLLLPAAVALLALVTLLCTMPFQRIGAVVVAVVWLVSFSHADKSGHNAANWIRKRLVAARSDLRAGRPLAEVVEVHGLFPESDYGVAGLCDLAAAHMSVFRDPAVPSPPECSVLSPIYP